MAKQTSSSFLCMLAMSAGHEHYIPTAIPPRRARPVITVLAQPALASLQVLRSNRPLCQVSFAKMLAVEGIPAIAALASNFSPESAMMVTEERQGVPDRQAVRAGAGIQDLELLVAFRLFKKQVACPNNL